MSRVTEKSQSDPDHQVYIGHHAALVAAGILLSRIAGLVRDRFFAYYFGVSDAADAFRAAFRIPNFLQNLFGEGVLSASFIPVYANLLAQGKEEEADRVASAVFCLLSLVPLPSTIHRIRYVMMWIFSCSFPLRVPGYPMKTH